MWDAHLVQGRLELRPRHTTWLPFNDRDPHITVGTRVRCVVEGKVWWETSVRAIGRVAGVIHVIDLYNDRGVGVLSYHPKDREAWGRFVQFELTWGDK